MKILDAGTARLSNTDVLAWIAAKNAQHKDEDAAERKAGRRPLKRPPNFLNALKRHEEALRGDAYPYGSSTWASAPNTTARL
jgi:hypothetical protein